MLTALDLSLGRILPSLAPPYAPTTASMPWPRALFMLGVTDAVESAPVPRVGHQQPARQRRQQGQQWDTGGVKIGRGNGDS